MKKISLVFNLACSLIAFNIKAQKLPNTLLWKISGNGLQKPSYLYGTMHLPDTRLFNLGDSLYKAIEKSDGFAIEVNPDEFTPFLVDLVKKQIGQARHIKDMMDKESYKKYSDALSRKLKKPAKDITTQDIFREKHKWASDKYNESDMLTFLDAYLFDIARRQGKWTGGVEDMADQKGLMDELIDESDIRQIALSDNEEDKKSAEAMIKMYTEGDLNKIDNFMNYMSDGMRDTMLIRRNKKMAWRMDSLGRARSMVFAVGAAHLPGKEGLIKLLQNRGFTVEPVISSKKIAARDYKVAEVPMPWVKLDDPNGYYSVQLPGKPSEIMMYGLINMQMYFNIFKQTAFLTCSINTPYGEKGADSLIAIFGEKVFGIKKLQGAKSITINGINGKELENKEGGAYKHGYVLYKKNVIYLVASMAQRNDKKVIEDIDKFLASFHPVEINTVAADDGYNYTDEQLAFGLSLPAAPQSGDGLVQKDDNNSIKSTLKVSVDKNTGAYFLFSVNEAKPGYNIPNDSSTLAKSFELIKDKFTRITLDTSYYKNHHLVREYAGFMSQANLSAKSYFEFRGNRWYALIAMYNEGKPIPAVDRYFKSFHLTDYVQADWKQRTSNDSLFTIWSPSPVELRYPNKKATSSGLISYEMYDSTRSDSYELGGEELGKYYWKKDDTTLYNRLVKNLTYDSDSLLNRRYVFNGNIKGLEFEKQSNGSMNIARKRMFLYGDSLYTLTTTQNVDYINSPQVNKFFEDFRFLKQAPLTHVFEPKTKILLPALLDKDSATRAQAMAAMNIAPFTVEDLPALHEALLQSYKADSSIKEVYSIGRAIKSKITALKDTSSLLFAKKNYVSTSNAKLKNELLELVTAYRTSENYSGLVKLLQQSPPLEELPYSIVKNAEDSMELAASLFPGILPFLKDTLMAPFVISIANHLLDSSRLSINELKSWQVDILSFARQRLRKMLSDKNNFNYGDRSLLQIIGRFNNPASNSILQQWVNADKGFYRMRAIKQLVKNNQQVNAAALQQLAADKYYRLDLFNYLKDANKQSIFPKQYLTQQLFGMSMVNEAIDNDNEDASILYVSQKTLMFRGKKYRFFFYKVGIGGEEPEYYLACAGPFDLDIDNMSVKRAKGYLSYDEKYDAKQLQGQMDRLTKKMEAWYNKEK